MQCDVEVLSVDIGVIGRNESNQPEEAKGSAVMDGDDLRCWVRPRGLSGVSMLYIDLYCVAERDDVVNGSRGIYRRDREIVCGITESRISAEAYWFNKQSKKSTGVLCFRERLDVNKQSIRTKCYANSQYRISALCQLGVRE